MTHLLVIDDDEALGRSIVSYLERRGFSCLRAIDSRTGMVLFHREKPKLTLVDYKLGRECGLGVLGQIREENPEAQVVVMTGHADVAVAVEAMKRGARDFLTKPAPLATIATMTSELVGNQFDVAQRSRGIRRILGRSNAAIKLRESVRKLAAACGTDRPPGALISGERGLAKAKLAAALHEESPRRAAALVTLNCETASPDTGSKTGWRSLWRASLEQARNGTLLLKNLPALSHGGQTTLVEAIENGLADEVWILATSSGPRGAVALSGSFSTDLLYRIQVGWIDVPALRERREDILPIAAALAQGFARKHGYARPRFTPKARAKLLSYLWPGNVSELGNCLSRAVLVTKERRIDAGDIHYLTEDTAPNRTEPKLDLQEIEQTALQSALKHAEGNVSRAADLLGITRDTLRYRMSKFGLSRKQR